MKRRSGNVKIKNPFDSYPAVSKHHYVLFCLVIILSGAGVKAQSISKKISTEEKLFVGYFNQTRFSKRLGLWSDVHFRTTDDFVKRPLQTLGRLAGTYFITDHFRLMIGYCLAYNFPEPGFKQGRLEHRPWQQLFFKQEYHGIHTIQMLRLEERYNQMVINNKATNDYLYTNRLRYSYLVLIPFSKDGIKPKKTFLVLNDEVFVNFGRNVIYNTFDQNRFFAGLGYQFNKSNSVHLGYMNIYQQSPAGNVFLNSHCIRVFYYHNLDFRKENN